MYLSAPKQPFFSYTPLDINVDVTRMLRLLPGHDGSQIECELQNVSFPVGERYHALSYEWGAIDTWRSIFVNGSEFHIRGNLHAFLQQIRNQLSAELPMLIWADVICIDQHSVHERNHQVKLMKQIYSEAVEVLVWLGEEADGSTELFGLLNDWVRCKDNSQRLMAVRISSDDEAAKICMEIVGHPKFSSLWRAAIPLSQRSYWGRMWVIQELLLNAHHRVFAGSCYLEQGGLKLANVVASQGVTAANTASTDSAGRSFVTSTAYRLTTDMLFFEATIHHNIWNLVLKFGKAECTFLCDKIYGLLGLASNGHNFDVDYDAPLPRVLAQVIVAETDCRGNLIRHLLNLLQLGPTSPKADHASFLTWADTFARSWQDSVRGDVLSEPARFRSTLAGTISELHGFPGREGGVFRLYNTRFRIDRCEAIRDGHVMYYLDNLSLCLTVSTAGRRRSVVMAAVLALESLWENSQCSAQIYAQNPRAFYQLAHQKTPATIEGSKGGGSGPLFRIPVQLAMLIVTAEPWREDRDITHLKDDMVMDRLEGTGLIWTREPHPLITVWPPERTK